MVTKSDRWFFPKRLTIEKNLISYPKIEHKTHQNICSDRGTLHVIQWIRFKMQWSKIEIRIFLCGGQ